MVSSQLQGTSTPIGSRNLFLYLIFWKLHELLEISSLNETMEIRVTYIFAIQYVHPEFDGLHLLVFRVE